jgi:hypothetical protein
MEEASALYVPSGVQQEAHVCVADEILYGGTAGCGKTVFLRWDPVITQIYDWNGMPGEHTRYVEALKRGEEFQSKGWALHIRRTYPMLLQTIFKVLDFAFKVDPGCHWDAENKILTWTCGYRIQFGHVQKEEDWRNYDSNDYTHLALDEVTQTLLVQFNMLRARVRSGDPILRQKLRVVLASNPDSPAEGRWVKERFVDPAPEGRQMLVETVDMFDGTKATNTRIYIPAFLSDNPDKEFARDYEKKLRSLPRHIMEARLFNKWDVVEGAFFEYEWIPSVHVVKPFTCRHDKVTCVECAYSNGLPNHYPRARVMDQGYKAANPIMWFAKNEDDDLIFYREVTYNHDVKSEKDRRDAQMVALGIKKVEQEHGEWDERRKSSKLTGPADYQICERRGGMGDTIEDTMAKEGVYWSKSTKNRAAATAEILRRLKDTPSRPGAHPALMVFENCTQLRRIMPLIKVDPNEPELPLKDDNGHWLECLMYACMYSLPKAEKRDRRSVLGDDDDDFDDKKKSGTKALGGYGS